MLSVLEWLTEFRKSAETSEKQVIPRKKNKIKDIRIVDTKSLIILNLSPEIEWSRQISQYKFLGQFREIASVKLLKTGASGGVDVLVTFGCEISSALSLFVR